LKKILLLVWIFAAISSSLSYDALAIIPSDQTDINQSAQEDQNDEDNSSKSCHYQIVKNVSPTLQVDFHLDLFFEFELPVDLDNTHFYNHFNENESEEYFKTLFHFIISPNAP